MGRIQREMGVLIGWGEPQISPRVVSKNASIEKWRKHVPAMVAMRRDGKTNREIGARFGICSHYVSQIINAFRSDAA